MIHRILIFFFTACCTIIYSQQRIGIDANTTGTSMNFTLSYQKVMKEHFLLNAGFFGGLLSYTHESHKRDELANGLTVLSPFDEINQPVNINDTTYQLMSYGMKCRGFGLQAGFGYFHEFSLKHGLKFFLNGRLGYSNTEALTHYANTALNREIERLYFNKHYFAALSPEINHTIRLTGRFTFSYGFKFPYYFLIDKKRYNTQKVSDSFYGLEPEFKLGVTMVVGKCDE